MTAPSPPRLFARSIAILDDLGSSHHRSAPALTLHTIQTCDAYETLRYQGTLSGRSRSRGRRLRRGAPIERRQMANRLPTAREGILWLWAKTNFRDLIGNTRYFHGDVLLTARVHFDRVR